MLKPECMSTLYNIQLGFVTVAFNRSKLNHSSYLLLAISGFPVLLAYFVLGLTQKGSL